MIWCEVWTTIRPGNRWHDDSCCGTDCTYTWRRVKWDDWSQGRKGMSTQLGVLQLSGWITSCGDKVGDQLVASSIWIRSVPLVHSGDLVALERGSGCRQVEKVSRSSFMRSKQAPDSVLWVCSSQPVLPDTCCCSSTDCRAEHCSTDRGSLQPLCCFLFPTFCSGSLVLTAARTRAAVWPQIDQLMSIEKTSPGSVSVSRCLIKS